VYTTTTTTATRPLTTRHPSDSRSWIPISRVPSHPLTRTRGGCHHTHRPIA
jgi:hypothetical protein